MPARAIAPDIVRTTVSMARWGARAVRASASAGWDAISSTAARTRSSRRGIGSGRHGAFGDGPSEASGSRSNNAEPINMLPIPSASAWWSFRSTPVRPSSSPSKTYSSHKGFDRSSGRERTRPTDRSNWRRPPGDGTAERRRWKSRSNRSSSTHTGRPRLPGTGRTRCRSRGARWIRASTTRCTWSYVSGPSLRGAKIDKPATCMCSAGVSRYRKLASKLERRSAAIGPC